MKEIKATHTTSILRVPKRVDAMPSLMLVLATRATALGMYPFGPAFFAASFDKSVAYIGVLAACIGLVTSAGIGALPKYLIAFILYWLFTRVYRKENEVIKSAACGISLALGGGVMLASDFHGLYDIFLLGTESIITALMYVVFRSSRIISDDFTARGRMSAEEYISAAITVGVMIAGMNGFGIYGISFTNVFSVYAIMITAMNSSLAIAGCTGMCIGFLSSMSGTDAVVMMGVYGMGALFACFMNSFKKIGCAIGYIGGTAVTLIYVKNMYDIPLNMFDTLIGAGLFLLTPKVVHEYFRCFFTKSMQVESVSPDRRMREYLTMRLRRASDAFSSLHECFMAVSEGRLKKYSEDAGEILDETAQRVCIDCAKCGKCWQTDFRKTYKNVLSLVGVIETDGLLTAENVPEHFCDRCLRTDMFIAELNHVYELYKRDVLRRSDAVVTRNLISAQYNELCKLFEGMAENIEEGFVFLETDEERIVDELDRIGIMPYEVSAIESASGCCEVYLRLPPTVKHELVEGALSSVLKRPIGYVKTEQGLSKYISRPSFSVDSAVLQMPQAGSRANGDSVTVFVSDNNKFYAISADGMGSGAEAQYESAATLRLLTSFLKSGFSVKTALGILNSAMCLNMDNEMYSTVDLICIDLYTGDAEIYKIGSAETILLCGGEVKSIASASVPMGILSDIRLDNRRFNMQEGDVVLFLTDGVTEAGYAASRTDWVKQIIVKPFSGMDELAHEVMDTALKKERGVAKDDMSVIAMRLIGI